MALKPLPKAHSTESEDVDGVPLMSAGAQRSDALPPPAPLAASLPLPPRPPSRRGSALNLQGSLPRPDGQQTLRTEGSDPLQPAPLASSVSLQPSSRRSSLGATLGGLAASVAPGPGAFGPGGAVQGLLPGAWSLPVATSLEEAELEEKAGGQSASSANRGKRSAQQTASAGGSPRGRVFGEVTSNSDAAWRGGGLDPKTQLNGSSPSAALSMESMPKAKAGAGSRRCSLSRRCCSPSWASVLLVVAAVALAMGLGVLVGHVAWPRRVDSIAALPGFLSRPDVVTSVGKAAPIASATQAGQPQLLKGIGNIIEGDDGAPPPASHFGVRPSSLDRPWTALDNGLLASSAPGSGASSIGDWMDTPGDSLGVRDEVTAGPQPAGMGAAPASGVSSVGGTGIQEAASSGGVALGGAGDSSGGTGVQEAPVGGSPMHPVPGNNTSGIDIQDDINATRAKPLLLPQVEVRLSIRNAQAALGASAELYAAAPGPSSAWELIGRTEVARHCEAVEFAAVFRCTYAFEKPKRLRVVLHGGCLGGTGSESGDSSEEHAAREPASPCQPSTANGKAVPLGAAETTLAEVLTARGQALTLPLGPDSAGPLVILAASEDASIGAEVRMRFRAQRLPIAEGDRLPSARLRLSRLAGPRAEGAWQAVAETDVLRATRNPRWEALTVAVQALCQGDAAAPLRLQVLDVPPGPGRHQVLCQATSSLRGLQEAAQPGAPAMQLLPPEPQGYSAGGGGAGRRSDAGECGALLVREVRLRRRPSLLDYMAGGCELNWMVALDFSDAAATDAKAASMHAPAGADGGPSTCQCILAAFGAILEPYDPHRRFPLWALGGAVGGRSATPCWALNGNGFQPEVRGLGGILKTYKEGVRVVQPGGATALAPVLAAVRAHMESLSDVKHRFFVLLVLLSRPPDDVGELSAVLAAIAAELPLALLVVGVGSEHYSALQAALAQATPPARPPGALGGSSGENDTAFEVNSASNGASQERVAGKAAAAVQHIAHFAAFRPGSGDRAEDVAAALLAKVPHIFMAHFRRCMILPKPPQLPTCQSTDN
ncbi:hypothetical protein WJX81_001113 [Elliptochloris bilobata]|uniref:C2 domain-containing protein n=1 Tax=Elliptochloris bilobata TaxID=381761 RepID=A0AAW1R330_9CHLO